MMSKFRAALTAAVMPRFCAIDVPFGLAGAIAMIDGRWLDAIITAAVGAATSLTAQAILAHLAPDGRP